MTTAQRLSEAYWNAAEVFDGDVNALAVALGGMLRRAEKKSDLTYVLRELNNGRLERFKLYFPKVDDLTHEEVSQCKAAAHLRFSGVRGQLEEVEGLSKDSDLMHPTLIRQELANLTAIQKTIRKIKRDLKKRVDVAPKAINEIRSKNRASNRR